MPSSPEVRIPFISHFPSLQESSIHLAIAWFFQKHHFNKETTEIEDSSLAGNQTPYNTLHVQSGLQPAPGPLPGALWPPVPCQIPGPLDLCFSPEYACPLLLSQNTVARRKVWQVFGVRGGTSGKKDVCNSQTGIRGRSHSLQDVGLPGEQWGFLLWCGA